MADSKASALTAASALSGAELWAAVQGGLDRKITASQVLTYVMAAIVDAAPATLDTLNELAAALGDDPNFATTVTNALAGKQPLDSDLTAIAALVSAANKMPYATGAGAWSLADLTAFARTILDDVDGAAVRTTIGAAALADVQTFTSSGTWTKPVGAKTVRVIIQGGGGGSAYSGGASATGASGGGGGTGGGAGGTGAVGVQGTIGGGGGGGSSAAGAAFSGGVGAPMGGGGGASGGGITSGNVTSGGGAGGRALGSPSVSATAGADNGGAGGTIAAHAKLTAAGAGGGGGGSSTSANGGAGGAGQPYGGGGGGGGSAQTGFVGGAGGAGGAGRCVVITYF
jgi:hypothetical protein